MNYKSMRSILLASIALFSATIHAAHDAGKNRKTVVGIIGVAAGSIVTALAIKGWDFYQKNESLKAHTKIIQIIENDLAENKELSKGRLEEMREHNKASKQFVNQESRETARHNKKEIQKRIKLWNQADVRNKLAQIVDEKEAQKYIQSIPEKIRSEVAFEIEELNQRLEDLNRQKQAKIMHDNDSAALERLSTFERVYQYQLATQQAKLKDAIQGDFGQHITPIINFCETLQRDIGRITSLGETDISASAKSSVQAVKMKLTALLRNTHVWLEGDMKRERIEQQDHEKIQIQLETDRAKQECQLKKSTFITNAQAGLSKFIIESQTELNKTIKNAQTDLSKTISDTQKAVAEMSSASLQAAAVIGSQANLIDEKLARRLSDHEKKMLAEIIASRLSEQAHHSENQEKLTEIQRVNLSNMDTLKKTEATVERLEASYRFDAQQRYAQQQAYAPQAQYYQQQPSAPAENM